MTLFLKIGAILAALGLLLAGCAAAVTPAAEPVSSPTALPAGGAPTLAAATQQAQPTAAYSTAVPPGSGDSYVVDLWVDEPAPLPGGKVIVRATLVKNGRRIGGAQMRTSWVQEGELQHCDILPVYLAGCLIDVQGLAPGIFVPVTVTMRYDGTAYRGYSGFTPQ